MTPKERLNRDAQEEREAQEYAIAIRTVSTDWASLNSLILSRYSMSALIRIKARAWRIVRASRD